MTVLSKERSVKAQSKAVRTVKLCQAGSAMVKCPLLARPFVVMEKSKALRHAMTATSMMVMAAPRVVRLNLAGNA